MTPIKNEIQSLETQIIRLKEKLKTSYESIKELWNDEYYSTFTDRCKMMYHLANGLKYERYPFNNDLDIGRQKNFNTKEVYDFCNIYKGVGSRIGFISIASGLFDASSDRHKDMWLAAIKENKEVRSFEDYKTHLKNDVEFLLSSFEEAIRERGTGVYSTESYVMEVEEKRLKTGKYYIYIEGTSRRI